jgi:hypothetical protein
VREPHVAVLDQRRAAHVARHRLGQEGPEREVDLAVAEPLHDRRLAERQRLERRAGRLVREQRVQRRQDDEQHVLGRRHPERPRALRRIERLGRPAEQALQVLHQRRDPPGQRLRAVGQRHLPADPDQERVAQRLSQPGQRVAHRRLAEAHPPGGPGHAPLAQERVQGHHQIHVDRGQVHRGGVARSRERCDIYHTHCGMAAARRSPGGPWLDTAPLGRRT